MAVAQTQCPHCHQTVPANVRTCPHCGVYLQLPAQNRPAAVLGVAQPSESSASSLVSAPLFISEQPLPPIATAQSLPDVLKQLDAAASTHLTISGVLIAFYAGAIFAAKIQASVFQALVYALPIILLLVTVILSVRVFYPAGYLTDDYPTLLRTKDARLRYSSLLLEISVGLLAISVFVYLMR
ncbi:MAG TPA: zinc-ribbon domain-containing protein [Ktedonobacteraceae bacterium]